MQFLPFKLVFAKQTTDSYSFLLEEFFLFKVVDELKNACK